MTIATSFPPVEASPYVLPGSTTPLVTREMLSQGGSNGFHIAWTPWLVMTSQPEPSSHQVFIPCMHLEWSAGYPLISDAHGAARNIRAKLVAWHLSSQCDLRKAHFARVRSCIEKQEAPLQLCKRVNTNFIWACVTKWEDMGCTLGTTPGYFLLPRTPKTQKPSISQRLYQSYY